MSTRDAKPARRRAEPLVAQAYAELKRRILDHEYPAGHQATEPDVAADLGMSRTPVREALIRLAQEGLVEVVPRRGMRVVPLSPADMQEIYEVLTALESEAAGLAARPRPDPRRFDALATAVDDMAVALKDRDLLAWAAADERFHRALLDLSGNRRLIALAVTMWDQVHRSRLATVRLRPLPSRSNTEHRALLAALRRGDAERAHDLHRRHRRRTARMLISLLKQHAMDAV